LRYCLIPALKCRANITVSLRDTTLLDDDPTTFGHFAEAREPDAKWQKTSFQLPCHCIALNYTGWSPHGSDASELKWPDSSRRLGEAPHGDLREMRRTVF